MLNRATQNWPENRGDVMSTKKWDDLTEDEQWEWFDKVREQYDEDEVGPQEAWRLAEQLFNYENPDDEDEVL